MIVAPSPAVQVTLRDGLIRAGVPEGQIHSFNEDEHALLAFDRVRPEAVLLDTVTQEIDPEDLVEAMLFEDPSARVVLVTELPPGHERLQELVAFGAFAVLHKPLDRAGIGAVVRKIDEQRPGAGRIT
jgi:DNA-binding NtrC family response regulator